MLFNDVVEQSSITNQIPNLDEIRQKDPDGITTVTINFPNHRLGDLIELSLVKFKDSKYLNALIVNATADLIKKNRLQHYTTSLTFNGEENIRKDVLQKLKAIAEYLETLTNFPELKIQEIKKTVDLVLGRTCQRTREKYFGCLKVWFKEAKGMESYYDSSIDVSGFKETVLIKMEELNSTPNHVQMNTQNGEK